LQAGTRVYGNCDLDDSCASRLSLSSLWLLEIYDKSVYLFSTLLINLKGIIEERDDNTAKVDLITVDTRYSSGLALALEITIPVLTHAMPGF
jgi:hypothetical protein